MDGDGKTVSVAISTAKKIRLCLNLFKNQSIKLTA